LFPEKDETLSQLSAEEKLQYAFLKTFPANLSMSADKDNQFPFFIMLSSQELVKLHGSSVLSILNEKPAYVCCQNLVVSTITNRKMAKCIIPISERVFETMPAAMHKLNERQKNRIEIGREVRSEQWTAILRYMRGKNHNEYIQGKLSFNDAYLETDEDTEKVIYFYLKNKTKAVQKEKEIDTMIAKIEKNSMDNIFKRNYMAPVSDKCKLHVNEFGEVVDILDSREFLSFLVKSCNKDIANHILEKAKKLNLGSKDIHLMSRKANGIVLVHLKDKFIAKALFRQCRKYIKEKKQVGSKFI
jgi:hypothetical protein